MKAAYTRYGPPDVVGTTPLLRVFRYAKQVTLKSRPSPYNILVRYLLSFLAVCGIVVSSLALHVHYSDGNEVCAINAHWDCGIVNHSPFAEIHGLPVAAIGIAGYCVLALLAFFRRPLLFTAAAAIGCAFALRLTWIEMHVLEVYCLYCVISQGIIALLLLSGLGWWFANLRQSSPARA